MFRGTPGRSSVIQLSAIPGRLKTCARLSRAGHPEFSFHKSLCLERSKVKQLKLAVFTECYHMTEPFGGSRRKTAAAKPVAGRQAHAAREEAERRAGAFPRRAWKPLPLLIAHFFHHFFHHLLHLLSRGRLTLAAVAEGRHAPGAHGFLHVLCLGVFGRDFEQSSGLAL